MGLMLGTAFTDPVILAVMAGGVVCAAIAGILTILHRRFARDGRTRAATATSVGRGVLAALAFIHLAVVVQGTREASAAEYALVLQSLDVKPSMVPALKEAMADGRMSTSEFWRLRDHQGMIARDDMREATKRVADFRRP
jgi:hypothetical protein